MSKIIPRNQTLNEMFFHSPCLQKLFCRYGLHGGLLECLILKRKDGPGGAGRGGEITFLLPL